MESREKQKMKIKKHAVSSMTGAYMESYEIISKNTYNVLQFSKNVEKPNDGTTKQGKGLHHE